MGNYVSSKPVEQPSETEPMMAPEVISLEPSITPPPPSPVQLINLPHLPQSPTIPIKPQYVHPFIDLINRKCTESEFINTLQTFCGGTEVGTDSHNNPIYEVVDQTEFIAPVLQVFSYCATNGKKSVVEWLCKNFVPLQVSYDNNFCYFECLKWGHHEIADIIAQHESFSPDILVLEQMLAKSKYDLFKKCMTSPYLRDDMHKYRYTFMHYIDQSQYTSVTDLLGKIKQRINGASIEIADEVYPNPRLIKLEMPVPQPIVNEVTMLAQPAVLVDDTPYLNLNGEITHNVPEKVYEMDGFDVIHDDTAMECPMEDVKMGYFEEQNDAYANAKGCGTHATNDF